MGRPKSEDPGILISFRIPKSLYAWWEQQANEGEKTTVAQLLKQRSIDEAKRGTVRPTFTEAYNEYLSRPKETDTGPSPHWSECINEGEPTPAAAGISPGSLANAAEDLRNQEAHNSAQLSEESPFKTRKPKPKQDMPYYNPPDPKALPGSKHALIVSKAPKEAKLPVKHLANEVENKPLARKQAVTNFKKDKK